MNKKIFALVISLLVYIASYSQIQNWEFGLMLGGSNYVGDINNMFKNGDDDSKELNQFETSFNMYNAHIMAGLIARYNFNPRWTLKTSLLFSKLSGDDKHFNNDRNLRFHSAIQELSANMEFNFLDYRTGSLQHRFTPYIFGGIALFHFNPKTEILDYNSAEEITVNLHDMHTEGQTFVKDKGNYHLVQLSIPFGLGMKFSLSKYVCFGLEWGFRKTFTDYIDDISSQYVSRRDLIYNVNENAAAAADRTHELDGYRNVYHENGEMRGNASTKDWYNFFGFTITSRLSTGRTKCLKN